MTASASVGQARSSTQERTGNSPPRTTYAALIADHPSRLDGAELRKVFDSVGIQYGPAFSGLVAAHTADGDVTTVLAEVALPGLIRSQQAAYGSHPALLDACFQSVVVHPDVQNAAGGGRSAVARGRAQTALLSADPQRALLPHPGDGIPGRRMRGRPRRARPVRNRADDRRGTAARRRGLGAGACRSSC